MNQLTAVALGGACGAVFRYLLSGGVYQWLGKEFPYGTLTVNVVGSLLIGLMTEALVLQRVILSAEYRAAILVGLFGSLTTFSTFSLDTFYLLEQGQTQKALLNILLSVGVCLLAVWLGLGLGRYLFADDGVIQWQDWKIPYGLLLVNFIGAFMIALLTTLLIEKAAYVLEHRVIFVTVAAGVFMTLSSLYLFLQQIEIGSPLSTHLGGLLSVLLANVMSCAAAFSLGLWIGRQI